MGRNKLHRVHPSSKDKHHPTPQKKSLVPKKNETNILREKLLQRDVLVNEGDNFDKSMVPARTDAVGNQPREMDGDIKNTGAKTVGENRKSMEMGNDTTNCGKVSSGSVAAGFRSLAIANKKKAEPLETDPRYFMSSVCAGYHVLSQIFQYLKVQDLLSAARVCKMWRDLATHPNLWKTVRMKNSQVTDWDGLADSLKRYGTQHLDVRKMIVFGDFDSMWNKFVTVIPRVTSLVGLELGRCPAMVVEEVIKSCPQLKILSAMTIKCDVLNLESVSNLESCQELRLKAIRGIPLLGDLSPLQKLTQLTHLSLTSVKELGKKRIDILASLINLETLELGECSDLPDKFGTSVLLKLEKLEHLRLEKGQGTCCTFDILDSVSKLKTLTQMELVNFDVTNGFDKCLSNCKNIKRLLIIPTYTAESPSSHNMVLGGVTELSNNLTHFAWVINFDLLRSTNKFGNDCEQDIEDSIMILKPVPCFELIKDFHEDHLKVDEKLRSNLTTPEVQILSLRQLNKLLLTALPKTRIYTMPVPFQATWRQSISDIIPRYSTFGDRICVWSM